MNRAFKSALSMPSLTSHELRQCLGHPAHALLDVLHRGRVREAYEPRRVEREAHDHGDPGGFDQPLAKLDVVLDLLPFGRLSADEGRQIRESVEGALGLDAGDAGDLPQARDHDLAALVELDE